MRSASIAAITASTSSPSTRASACAMSASSSSSSVRREPARAAARAAPRPRAPAPAAARGDDRAARARGREHARARLHQQRHAEALEVALLADRRARGRVAGVDVALRVLRQPDRHQAPVELLAVAPVQDRQRGAGRVGERTARVGEVRDRDPAHCDNDCTCKQSLDARHGCKHQLRNRGCRQASACGKIAA